MPRLRILGAINLETHDGSSLRTVAGQPKLIALLAYLAASRPHGQTRRDTLLALLWPELDSAAARHALSQALSVLRGELGPDVLDGKYREHIELGAALWCDATAFRDDLRKGRLREALELYQGPLLDGFYVSAAPGFERWLEDERRELQSLAARAALELASDARLHSRWSEGCAWAERAITIAPYEEPAWRESMKCYHGAGDHAAAAATFQLMTQRFAADLGVEPSPATIELISSMRLKRSADDQFPPMSPASHPPAMAFTTRKPEATAEKPARTSGIRRIPAILAITITLVLLGWWAARYRSSTSSLHLDPQAVAIAPFHVTGADSIGVNLEAGMVDLLAIKLAGSHETRAVDPRTLLFAWKKLNESRLPLKPDWPIRLGTLTGAGNVLTGGVTVALGRVTMTATLQSVPGARVRGYAAVEGPTDSLLILIDRLAAKVLALASGEEVQRIETLATTSLPALQEYLAGRAEHRAGHFAEAIQHFDRALEMDSSFALAGLGILSSSSWGGPRGAGRRGHLAAWANRDRLGRRDSLRLLAILGFRRPDVSPLRDHIAFVERTLTRMPDDPEMWYELGDLIMHNGAQIAIADWRARAAAAFSRALKLDSTFTPPLVHLIQLAADRRDTAEIRRLHATYVRIAPTGHDVLPFRWLMQALSGDSTRTSEFRRTHFAGFDRDALTRVIMNGQSFGVGMGDVVAAQRLLEAHAATAAERAEAARFDMYLALARGRPADAERARQRVIENENDPGFRHAAVVAGIHYGLFWDGSIAAAEAAVEELAPAAQAPLADSARERGQQLSNTCAVELWGVSKGKTRGTRDAIAKLRSAAAPLDFPWVVRDAHICAALLEVAMTKNSGGLPSTQALARFDSTLTALPLIKEFGASTVARAANLVSAELWLARGDTLRALAALQRRGHTIDARLDSPAYLRDECRVGMKAGRPDIASAACRRFLSLRSDPEPRLRPQVDSIRAEFASFQRGSQ